MTTEPQIIAGDSVHYYDAVTGAPVWQITGKNGKPRQPYVKEAIAMGLVPGVTTITKQAWSYGLQNYFVEQALWAALTLPRLDGETDEAYIERIKEDSKTHARGRRDEGTELHKAIDLYVLGEAYDTKWDAHIEAVQQAVEMHGYDLKQGKPQVTFATQRYGGTADLVFSDAIWDWKSKDMIVPGKKLAYDEQCQQLSAYEVGLRDGRPRKLFNVFVGVKDAKVQVHEWDEAQATKAFSAFSCLLSFWWLKNERSTSVRTVNP